jgi:hypothetical protein
MVRQTPPWPRRKFKRGDLTNRLGLFAEQLAFCIGGADERARWRQASRQYRARQRGKLWERFCRRRDDPMVIERVQAVFHFHPALLRLVLDLNPDGLELIGLALAGGDLGSSRARPPTLAGLAIETTACQLPQPRAPWGATAWGSPWPRPRSARQAMVEVLAGLAGPAPGSLAAVVVR